MQVAIIGLAGMGAAHAVACAREGYQVLWVLDIDESLRARYSQSIISNTWGPIDEHATWNPPTFHVADARHFLPCVDRVDLLIVAVPNHLHQAVVDAWLPHVPRMLLEKPARVQVDTEFADRLVVNYEYTNHPNLSLMQEPPVSLSFYHNGLVPMDGAERVWPVDDLAPHLLSVLAHWFSLHDASLRVKVNTPTDFVALLTVPHRDSVHSAILRCGYRPTGQSVECVFQLASDDHVVNLSWDDSLLPAMYLTQSNYDLNRTINQLLRK